MHIAVHSSDADALRERAWGLGRPLFDKLECEHLLERIERQTPTAPATGVTAITGGAPLAQKTELICSLCRYGIVSCKKPKPDRCPMCGGSVWADPPVRVRRMSALSGSTGRRRSWRSRTPWNSGAIAARSKAAAFSHRSTAQCDRPEHAIASSAEAANATNQPVTPPWMRTPSARPSNRSSRVCITAIIPVRTTCERMIAKRDVGAARKMVDHVGKLERGLRSRGRLATVGVASR
jgi:hypothetical protein